MGFINTGLSVLEGSNYSVLLAIGELDVNNLTTNIGFYFFIFFWLSFYALASLFNWLDRRQLSRNFDNKLFL